MMKTTLAFAALVLATVPAAAEGPHTAPALSLADLSEVFSTMPAGDADAGADLHQKYWCASCHGPGGHAQSRNYPSVAGQVATYTYKTLSDYRDGRRMEGTGRAKAMAASVAGLSDQDLADLAAFYARAEAPKGGGGAKVEDIPAEIVTLVRKGDPQRLITPCASCHGVTGGAGIRPETPALAGVEADYLMRTLTAYRDGSRANDTAEGMRFFARQLTDEEIRQLSAYYAAIGG